ncbi:MAG: zinc ribbon domain-containing protein [Gammaproteobacteria bacterium]|nr:zinc ribbon domain-containing protein [Gammaproteobacteria bacterium]
MQCPRCQFERIGYRPTCQQCGIKFHEYYQKRRAQKKAGIESEDPVEFDENATAGIKDILLFPGSGQQIAGFVFCRAALLAFLAFEGLRMMATPIEDRTGTELFMHLVHLPFHEAGHTIFAILGNDFIASAGGSLGQLLMPAICLGVFLLKHSNTFGAAMCGWWLGQSFVDMTPYINDAIHGDLPLLGGNYGHTSPYGAHDWEYLLTETGLLFHCREIALAAHWVGSAIMIAALVWGALVLFEQFRLLRG